LKIEIKSEVDISKTNIQENTSNKSKNKYKNDNNYNDRNKNSDLTLLKKLDLLENIYEILRPFYYKLEIENKKENLEENLNEYFELILNKVVIKYIELEYLNNPYQYSRKTKNKINSFSDKDKDNKDNKYNNINQNNSEFINEENKIINEKKIVLLNNYMNLVFLNIEKISFCSYLEIIMMDQEESESIIYMKLNLLIKIIEKFPLINLDDNLSILLEIYLQNMDKNIKIDNVLILCIKNLINYYGINFNERLNSLNNDGIVIQINEFIENNIKLTEEIKVNKNEEKEINYINNHNINELNKNKNNNYIYNSIQENKNALCTNNIIIDDELSSSKKANVKEEELIVIDMNDNDNKENSKPQMKKSLTNKFKKYANKEENENQNNNPLETNFIVEKPNNKEKIFSEDSKSKSSKNINPIINEIREKNPYNNQNQNQQKFTYINIDDININKKNSNENEDTFNLVDENIDPKKKKEKDLADFERMLEEQMLLESKKMEEKGNLSSGNIKGILPKKIIKKNETEKNINKNDNQKETQVQSKHEKEKESLTNIAIKNEENNNKPISKKINPDPKKTIDIEEKEDDEIPGNMKSAELENYMSNLIGTEISDLLNSEKWNERKDGFVLFYNFLRENIENNNKLLKNNMQYIVSYLKLKLKNYKETNFNILRENFNIYSELIKNFSQNKIFEKKYALGILKAFWDKMSDTKVKENLTNLLLVIMEYFTPAFVLQYFFKQSEKAKTNPILKEYALLIEKCVDEFGIENLPIKDIVEFCKTMSANTNPQIRNSSTSLLCVLYKFIGKDMKILLKDIKEATFKLIEVELDKVEIISNTEKEKRSAKRNVINTENDGKATNEKNGVSLNDQLFARVDISKKLTPKLIKDLNEGKWGEKKAALEAIEKILLEANNKILHNGISEIFLPVFKARLNDSNKNVVRLMIQILTKLIEAMGPNFKQMSNSFFKNITPLLIGNLADKMLLLREDVLICMEKWALNSGIENIITYIPEYLKNDNTEMKNDIFKFLGKFRNLIEKNNSAQIQPQQYLKEFCSPLLKCLQDKIQQIRTNAEEFICFTLKYVNISNYLSILKDLKPAIANDLKKILDSIQIIHLENESQNLQNIETGANNNSNTNNNSNKNQNLNKNFSSEIIKNEKNSNNNIITVVKTNFTNTKNNSENGNDNMNLSELKQDSVLSCTINIDDLRSNSQVLSSTNKSNSKSVNSYKNKINVNKISNAPYDKSAEKTDKKRKIIESKTPENNYENSNYNKNNFNSTSNFGDGNNKSISKTPIIGVKGKNKINPKGENEEKPKIRIFSNEEDNNATNLSSNIMIINNSTNKNEIKSGNHKNILYIKIKKLTLYL
jgi:hypothetical protein